MAKSLLMLIIPSLIEELERKFKITEYQVGDRVRITKYKNIFIKGYTENWSREILEIKSELELQIIFLKRIRTYYSC